MRRTALRSVWVLAVLGAWQCGPAASPTAMAIESRSRSADDLFYNFYTQPGYGGAVAEMYLSPRPTPPLVGHTYITYQPLMPSEFLYRHQRNYTTCNAEGGVTRTSVRWGSWLYSTHKREAHRDFCKRFSYTPQ